jgi:prolyl-tRNA synthetase
MRYSQLLIPTFKEDPSDAEVSSHKLLLRAGMVQQAATGIYFFLPLGLKVLQKIAGIIRNEMNKAGAQEVMLPVLQPSELWRAETGSGRWDDYGNELIKVRDRNSKLFCLAPTHEELAIALLKRTDVKSYRDFPLVLYQIQQTFCDELMPKFGLVYAREFMMSSSYSFDVDQNALNQSYSRMREVFGNILTCCGLRDFRFLKYSANFTPHITTEEFVSVKDPSESASDTKEATTGKATLCSQCQLIEDLDIARRRVSEDITPKAELLPVEEIYTPNQRTIENLKNFLKSELNLYVGPDRMIKTMIYQADDEAVAVLVPGDRAINEQKLQHLLGCQILNQASEDVIVASTGAPVGFAGPVGLEKVKIIADKQVPNIWNGITGANKADKHLINVNINRDYKVDTVGDIVIVGAGDCCPECGAPLKMVLTHGLGQIAQLGTKYTSALNATFTNEQGKDKPLFMGGYKLKLDRIMAEVVERNHDSKGIIWPLSLAPFQVIITVLNVNDSQIWEASTQIYEGMAKCGIEVLLDDRDENPGVKFNDADLLGIPIRVTIGQRGLRRNKFDITVRKTGEQFQLERDKIVDKTKVLLEQQLNEMT